MIFLNNFLICLVLTTFPLLLYFFYIGYNISNNKKEDEIIFNMAILGSIYILLVEGTRHDPKIALMMTNIPLLLAYVKKEKYFALLISICLLIYSNIYFSINIPIVIAQIIFLFSLCIIKEKFYLNKFTFITIHYLSFLEVILLRYNKGGWYFEAAHIDITFILILPLTYIATIIVIYLFKQGEKITKYHIVCEEIMKEKNVRLSLYKITHEIKNPLSVVKGYLQILENWDEQNAKKYFPIIKEEIDHALIILEDISQLSKVKINKSLVRIDELIYDVLKLLEDIIDKTNIKLSINLANDVYGLVDESKMKQVLVNILKNSFESIEKQEIKKVAIKLEETNKLITIIIKDNGKGCSKEELEKIGTPLFTTKQKGTGLGVALSKEIIKAHNGTLVYKSEEFKYMKAIIRIKK